MLPMKDKTIVQNESLVDRSLRVLLGVIMLAVPCYLLVTNSAANHIGLSLSMLLSIYQVGYHTIYPILSGVFGVDPFYYLFNKKSCDLSERNRCGTLPSQFNAMFHPRHRHV